MRKRHPANASKGFFFFSVLKLERVNKKGGKLTVAFIHRYVVIDPSILFQPTATTTIPQRERDSLEGTKLNEKGVSFSRVVLTAQKLFAGRMDRLFYTGRQQFYFGNGQD